MNKHVKISGTSTATSKGQVTIPKPIRDALGIKDGTPVDWTYEDGELTVRAKTRRLEDFEPMIPPNGAHATIEDMNRAIGEAVTERMKRAAG
ncbi:MAG: AbrB/MazE/SpoVT family DNA-binding domain-containing protein [Devosia sp.]|jgi:AbrB family looped-hinge helix DNA binding protein|nr:AbrB/MazE/SpoVT family DNA-binding domain-containing protein [Devosia sp.]